MKRTAAINHTTTTVTIALAMLQWQKQENKIGDGNNNNIKDKNTDTTKTMMKVSSGISNISSFNMNPPNKNNQPAVLLASFNATSEKRNRPAALVVWLCLSSSIASYNATSQKTPGALVVWLLHYQWHLQCHLLQCCIPPPKSTCSVSNLFQHHVKKKTICGIGGLVLCVCSGISDVSSSFNAMSLQKNNKPVPLFNATSKKRELTCSIGGLAGLFQWHW